MNYCMKHRLTVLVDIEKEAKTSNEIWAEADKCQSSIFGKTKWVSLDVVKAFLIDLLLEKVILDRKQLSEIFEELNDSIRVNRLDGSLSITSLELRLHRDKLERLLDSGAHEK